MAETVEELQKKVDAIQKKFDDLGLKGKAKLYYSLNRNMSDISDMLDSVKFVNINLEDPKDKTMERLKMLWASVKPLAETLNILEATSGITGDEKKDTAARNVLEFAESRK